MNDSWELTLCSSSGESYATNLETGVVVSLEDYFKAMVDCGKMKMENRYEEVFIKQKDGSYIKEVRNDIVYLYI